MNGIDISTGTAPTPISGLLQGFGQGLNAGTLIQENRMKRDAEQRQIAQTAQQNARQDAMDVGNYLEKDSIPDDFKVLTYNQKVQPWLESIGVKTPMLTEWDPEHNKLAKQFNAFMKEAQKPTASSPTGMHPQDIQNGLAMLLSGYSEERQKSYKPLLDSLKEQSKNETDLAKAKASAGVPAANNLFKKEQAIRNVTTLFNANPEVRKIQSEIGAADEVGALANSNTPIGQEMVKNKLARLSGDVGKIPQSERDAMGGSKSIVDNATRIFNQKTTGKPLLAQDITYMNQLADLLGKQAKDRLAGMAQNHAAQYASPDFASKDELMQKLIPGFTPGAVPASSGKPTQVNTQADYDALPKGAQYIDSEGTPAVKQ